MFWEFCNVQSAFDVFQLKLLEMSESLCSVCILWPDKMACCPHYNVQTGVPPEYPSPTPEMLEQNFMSQMYTWWKWPCVKYFVPYLPFWRGGGQNIWKTGKTIYDFTGGLYKFSGRRMGVSFHFACQQYNLIPRHMVLVT